MKNRTDKTLSLLFAVSVIGYFLLFFVLQDVSFPPGEFVFLWYAAPVIPAFCFQLLLCRNIKRKWAAALPAVLLICWCLLCLIQMFINTGWDALGWAIFLALSSAPAVGCALGWAIFLALSSAPAVGCALAWAAYGLHRLYKRGNTQ